jgi:hypothetical protein
MSSPTNPHIQMAEELLVAVQGEVFEAALVASAGLVIDQAHAEATVGLGIEAQNTITALGALDASIQTMTATLQALLDQSVAAMPE